LSEFQKKRGLVVTAAQVDVESARLTSIEAALAAAVADSAETSSRQRNAGTEASVDVQQSTAIQGLKGDLARAETKLNEISTTYGPNHPARIQLEAQIAELKDQISKEMRRVSGATSNVNRIAGQKIGELRAMAEAQKRTVLAMRAERDEASVLLRDLETAQKAYEQVAQRRAQLANESQADQATARILSPAQEAVKQSFPNIVVTAVVAVALGLVLGVGAALCWEALDRRIRGEADMHVVDGIPLLGVISARAARPGEVRRLVPARPGSGPPRLEMERGG
jgi:uncharacterized protein involved in exopolysaccharide biosynthesis